MVVLHTVVIGNCVLLLTFDHDSWIPGESRYYCYGSVQTQLIQMASNSGSACMGQCAVRAFL